MFSKWKSRKKAQMPLIVEAPKIDEEKINRIEKRVKQIEDNQAELEYNHKVITQSFETVSKHFSEMSNMVERSLKLTNEAITADMAERDKDMIACLDKISEALGTLRQQIDDPF